MGALKNKPTVSNSVVKPYAPAESGLKDILTRAQAIGNDPSVFKPNFSQNTTQGLSALGQLGQTPSQGAAAINPIVSGSGQAYGAGNEELMKTARGGYQGQNPYLDQVLKNANQLTADGVNSQFSAAGRYGSGAQTTALARVLGEQNLGALSDNYERERGNQLSAAQNLSGQGFQGAALAPQLDQLPASRIGLQIAAGEGQDQNDSATRLAPLAALQAQSSLTNPIAGLGRTENGSTLQKSNGLSQGIGLGLTALSLFSDERMKENITEVGKTHDGQKIYSYNYKGDPKTSLGLLAQEVEETTPDAVGEAGGMKMVNYKMATKNAERGKTRSPSSLGLLAG